MCDTFVLDKDGVHAAAVVGDMVRYLADKGLTLNDQLGKVWDRLIHNLIYPICNEQNLMSLKNVLILIITLSFKFCMYESRYGRHTAITSYFLCYSQPTIQKIFSRLRNFHGNNQVRLELIANIVRMHFCNSDFMRQ